MDTIPISHYCAHGNCSEDHNPRKISDQSPQTLRNPSILLQSPFVIVDGTSDVCRGFSIREYVAKVRRMNIRKCWPFYESLLEDSFKEGRNQLLPPLDKPRYRCGASQHSRETAGDDQQFGTSFHTTQRHCACPENNTTITEGIMIPDIDLGISQDLEEVIRDLSRLKIWGQDKSNTNTKDGTRSIRQGTYEGRYDYSHRQRSLLAPFVRAATWTLKSTSQSDRNSRLSWLLEKAKDDGNVEEATENQNQRRIQNFTYDLMKGGYKSFGDVGIGEETEKVKKVTKVAHDHGPEASILILSEKDKIDNLCFQGSMSESARHNILDSSENEDSGLKVCPVCKRFSSTTVTALDVHVDDCRLESSTTQKTQGKLQKQKSRTQKERSIVDIIATAPTVDSENMAGNSAIAICKSNKKKALSEATVGKIIPDDLPTVNCKLKNTIEANSTAAGKAGKRKAKTVKKERKRQRLGVSSSVSKGLKALKMPSVAVHLKETDNVVEHNLKPSSLAEDTRDFNVQQLPSMKVNSVQNYLPKNRHQQSGIRSNHVCPANMFPEDDKGKEGNVCNNIILVEKGGMLFGEEKTGEPFSILAMENSTTDASHSYGMKDSANNQSSPCHSPSDDNGCRDQKAYNNGSSRFQVEETSKSEVPNALNLSSKNPLEKITSHNPGKTGEPKQSNVIYGKSEFSSVHSREEERCPVQRNISDQDPEPVRCSNGFVAKTEVKNDQQGNVKDNLGDISTSSCTQRTEWEKENTAVVHSLQKKRLICETREVTEESHMRNAGLNFEKKVCVFPRDSRIMNRGIPGDIPYPQQRRGHTHEFINPSNSLPNTSAMEKESDHVKEYLSENASGLVKFSIHGNCSDYGYKGFPLDSQGAVLHHLPNAIPRFNQLYMIPNYPASNEPLISHGTKAFLEFNFVESLKTFPDVPPINRPLHVSSFHCLPQQNYSAMCKQPDIRQENSVSKTNLSNPDMRGSEYSSLLDEIRRDGGSNARIYGSSFGTPDTISRFSMHPTVQSRYSGDKRQKASIFEKTCAEVDISRRKQSTTQAVMRLMGHSFSIGGESQTGNALRDTHQWNSKDNQSSSSGAIVGVSSPMKLMTHCMDHCTACNKGQFFLPKPGGNAFCHDCRGKANIEKNLSNNFCKETRCSKTLATHKVGTFNNDAPDLVEKRLLADCLLHVEPLNDRNDSGQAWKSNPPFSSSVANMFISPISYLSNNTCLTEGQKKGYRASHVSKPGCPVQKQTYIELLNSCLTQQTFQKQDCNPLERHQ